MSTLKYGLSDVSPGGGIKPPSPEEIVKDGSTGIVLKGDKPLGRAILRFSAADKWDDIDELHYTSLQQDPRVKRILLVNIPFEAQAEIKTASGVISTVNPFSGINGLGVVVAMVLSYFETDHQMMATGPNGEITLFQITRTNLRNIQNHAKDKPQFKNLSPEQVQSELEPRAWLINHYFSNLNSAYEKVPLPAVLVQATPAATKVAKYFLGHRAGFRESLYSSSILADVGRRLDATALLLLDKRRERKGVS